MEAGQYFPVQGNEGIKLYVTGFKKSHIKTCGNTKKRDEVINYGKRYQQHTMSKE